MPEFNFGWYLVTREALRGRAARKGVHCSPREHAQAPAAQRNIISFSTTSIHGREPTRGTRVATNTGGARYVRIPKNNVHLLLRCHQCSYSMVCAQLTAR